MFNLNKDDTIVKDALIPFHKRVYDTIQLKNLKGGERQWQIK
jgi:hypothetical protein